MNPQQFYLCRQVDNTLAAGLQAAAAQTTALQQAINAGERIQRQQTASGLLQANVLHQTRASIPLLLNVAAATVPTKTTTVGDEDTSLIILAEPAVTTTSTSPNEVSQDIATQLIVSNTPASLDSAPDCPALALEERTEASAALTASADRWRIWLLTLVLGITVGLTIWVSWQAALAWASLASFGAGLAIATRSRRHSGE